MNSLHTAVVLKLLAVLASALPCEDTGLCSVGLLDPFVGDVRSSDGLRAALAARSFKKEVIVIVASIGQMERTKGDPLLPTMQIVGNVRRWGMEHILLMSTDAQGCQLLLGHFPELGCVWDSFKLPQRGKDVVRVAAMASLWHSRWRVTARAVRLGYNVFNLDSDLILFDDPYRYFKSPPFNEYVIINQPEILYHQGEYTNVVKPNGGVVYIQNARPDGPATWLVAEVSDRILRWVEDDFNTTQSKGLLTSCCYMDQDCFEDAISGVQMGRPFFRFSMRNCVDSAWVEQHKEQHQKRYKAVTDATAGLVQSSVVDLPEWMQPIAGDNKMLLRWFNMKLPNSQGSWPEEWGGNLFPAQRGPLSLEFQQQLMEDCGCPMWPNPENASLAEAAANAPSEKFLWGPPFLTLNYNARGRLGYWNQHLTGGVPQQVIGHAHYIPDADASVGKQVMKMMSADFDWGMAHQLRGDAVFFANQGQMGSTDLPDIVALHPDVNLQRLATFAELSAVLTGLVQVAVATGRAALWPALPCIHPLANEDQQQLLQLPLPLRPDWLPQNGPREQLQCTWLYCLSEACLFEGRGMLPVEFEHLQEHYNHRHELLPSRHNTIAVPASRAVLGNLSLPLSHSIVEVNEADLRELVTGPVGGQRQYDKYKVLYLRHPLAVKWTVGEASRQLHIAQYRDCRPLDVRWLNSSFDYQMMIYKKWQPDHIRIRPGKLRPDGSLLVYQARRRKPGSVPRTMLSTNS